MTANSSPYQKMSASGLDLGQLALLRTLLGANKQPPQLKIAPVQNIGQGIAEGVGNIANAIGQHRFYQQQNAELDNLLRQQQVQSQQEMQQQQAQAQVALQARANAYVQSGGKPENAMNAAMQPDAVYNKLIDGIQAQQADSRKGTVAGEEEKGRMTGRGEGVKALSSEFPNTNPNTVNGNNLLRQLYPGIQPETFAGLKKQLEEANQAGIQTGILHNQAPDLSVKPGLENQDTVAGINSKNASTANTQAQLPGIVTENQLKANHLTRDNTVLQAGQNTLTPVGAPGHLTFPQYAQQAATFSNDPIKSMAEILHNKSGFGLNPNTLDPQVSPPQLQQPQGPSQMVAPLDFHLASQLGANSSPEQIATARAQLFSPLTNAASQFGSGVNNFVGGLQQHALQAQMLLGIPSNPQQYQQQQGPQYYPGGGF